MIPFVKDRHKTCLIALFLLLAPTVATADPVEDIYQPYAGLLADIVVEHDLPDDGLITSFDYRGIEPASVRWLRQKVQ